MAIFGILDAGPLGLACHSPGRPGVLELNYRLSVLWPDQGIVVVTPEIVDYELRRKLIHKGFLSAIDHLNVLKKRLTFLRINSSAMERAAHLWAEARRAGSPTASDASLDGDVILAAQAIDYTGASDDWAIITDNPAHIGRFARTADWRTFHRNVFRP